MENVMIRQAMTEALTELEEREYVFTEETIQLAQKVLDLCKELEYKEGMAFALLSMGRVYSCLNDYQNSMTYSFDAINLAQELNFCDIQVLAFINIGSVYFDTDDFEKSLDYYNAALGIMDIFRHSKNYFVHRPAEHYLSKIYTNIGEVYRLHDLYQEAARYYELAYAFDKDFEFAGTFGIIQTNLGYIQCHLKHYDQAIAYLKDSISYLQKYDYGIGLLEAYDALGKAYCCVNDFVTAETYFAKALEVSSKIEYAYPKVDLYMHYATFLENNGRDEEAVCQLLTAYELCQDSQLFNQSMEICRTLIRYYEKLNMEKETSYYYRLYFENRRNQEPIKRQNKTRRLQMKLKFDELEAEKRNILQKSEQFRRETKELSETVSNISAISEMGLKLTTSSELPSIYQMLWNTISEFMEPNVFGIGLFDEEKDVISYPFYIENNIPIKFKDTSLDNASSMAAKCLREKRTIIVDDLQNEYLSYLSDADYIHKNNCFEVNSVLFCPLVIEQQRIGVITIQSYEKNFFSVLKIESIKAYASYAAIAINHAIKSRKLIDEVEKRKYLQAQLESSNEQLSYLSQHDALTGLPNKRKFDQVMKETWAKTLQMHDYMAVALFDIDFFKQFNDHYGHTEGDRCLYSVSNLVKKAGGKEVFISRFGGDEFVMIFANQQPQKVKEVCERIRLAVESKAIPHVKSEIAQVVTITIGVYILIPDSTGTTQNSIIEADGALYDAKKKGRNQVVYRGLEE